MGKGKKARQHDSTSHAKTARTRKAHARSGSQRQRSMPRRLTPMAYDPSTLTECPKCHGLLTVVLQESSQPIEIRCINCGWQPQWGMRIIDETEEARTIRRLTTQFSAQDLLSSRRMLKRAG